MEWYNDETERAWSIKEDKKLTQTKAKLCKTSKYNAKITTEIKEITTKVTENKNNITKIKPERESDKKSWELEINKLKKEADEKFVEKQILIETLRGDLEKERRIIRY